MVGDTMDSYPDRVKGRPIRKILARRPRQNMKFSVLQKNRRFGESNFPIFPRAKPKDKKTLVYKREKAWL